MSVSLGEGVQCLWGLVMQPGSHVLIGSTWVRGWDLAQEPWGGLLGEVGKLETGCVFKQQTECREVGGMFPSSTWILPHAFKIAHVPTSIVYGGCDGSSVPHFFSHCPLLPESEDGFPVSG